MLAIIRRVKEKKDGTFWWVMLFGFALYKFARTTGWVDVPVWYGFPLMLILAGLAFVVMVAARPKAWQKAVRWCAPCAKNFTATSTCRAR